MLTASEGLIYTREGPYLWLVHAALWRGYIQTQTVTCYMDVIATIEGKGAGIIEARKAEVEDVRKALKGTPWKRRDGLYRKLRGLCEEPDVIRVVAG